MAPKVPQRPQVGAQRAQDGPQEAPRWAQNRSQICRPRLSNIEAKKGTARANLKRGFGPFLGPSWGPYRPYVGPLGVIFGLILSILKRKAQKPKNEGCPTRNPHFWGPKRALEGPCWGHVGVKLASSGHLNISSHHLSDEGRYKRGRVTFLGGVIVAPGAPGEGDLGGGNMDQWIGSSLSRTPMGQRPGEFSSQ